MDNWLQTVIKGTEFKKTFDCDKIRSKQDGSFTDHVLGHYATWKAGEIPTAHEIVVLKLYTDWDDLQFELKKCFRLESVEDVLQQYSLRSKVIPADLKRLGTHSRSKSAPVMASKMKWEPSGIQKSKTTSFGSSSLEISAREGAAKLEQRLSQFYHVKCISSIFIDTIQ